jgi:dCMP deaminase
MDKWDSYFIGIAKAVAGKSPCLSRQIGAILVRDRSIIATGYNGPARGIPHCDTRGTQPERCPRQELGYKSGEGLDFCIAEHAERNTIANAARMGVTTLGATMYMTCGIPCKNCLTLIINAGITELVCCGLDTYDKMSEFIIQHSSLVIRSVR